VMISTELVSGPEVEPVSLEEAKVHLNVTGSAKDEYITSLIVAARTAIERYLNRALITQEWKVFYDCWKEEMETPFPPLQSIETVKYYDMDGDIQTLDEEDFYWVVNTREPGMVKRKYNASYPNHQDGRPDVIEIAFTAGFGDEAEDVPEPIRLGIKLMLTDYYEHRGGVVIGQVMKIPDHVLNLIHPYRIYRF
jgi:uncharacterized phiE125 gp8 family phage protein